MSDKSRKVSQHGVTYWCKACLRVVTMIVCLRGILRRAGIVRLLRSAIGRGIAVWRIVHVLCIGIAVRVDSVGLHAAPTV